MKTNSVKKDSLIKSFCLKTKSFVFWIFHSTIFNIKKPIVFIPVILFLISLPLSSVSFYHNVNNTLYGLATHCQNQVLNKKALCVGISSNTIFSKEKENYTQWTQIGTQLNANYYIHSRAGTLMMPIDDKEEPLLCPGNIGECVFETRVSSFFAFLNETKGKDYFASILLRKYDLSENGIDFRSYPFEGKDGSSYISDVLADSIIENDTKGIYKTYDDLLGEHYSISINGVLLNLSINNIYFSDKYLGPAIKGFAKHPIILDFSKIESVNNFKLFTSCIGDSTGISNIVKFLSTFDEDVGSFSVHLPNVDGDLKIDEDLSKVFNETVQDVKSASLLSGTNFIFLFLFLAFYSAFIILIIINMFKRKISSHFIGIGFILFCFSLVILIMANIFCKDVTFFFAFNLFTLLIAFATPLFLMILGLIYLKEERDG